MNIEQMSIFKPAYDNPSDLPNYKGIYLITATDNFSLPQTMHNLNYMNCCNRSIIYLGISNKGIKQRDFKNHFNGTARNSTLRKSLGVLLNLKREYEKDSSHKFKFSYEDEIFLTKWMSENLWLHYIQNEEPHLIEKRLINEYHPPLNLKENYSIENNEFRHILKKLRKQQL